MSKLDETMKLVEVELKYGYNSIEYRNALAQMRHEDFESWVIKCHSKNENLKTLCLLETARLYKYNFKPLQNVLPSEILEALKDIKGLWNRYHMSGRAAICSRYKLNPNCYGPETNGNPNCYGKNSIGNRN